MIHGDLRLSSRILRCSCLVLALRTCDELYDRPISSLSMALKSHLSVFFPLLLSLFYTLISNSALTRYPIDIIIIIIIPFLCTLFDQRVVLYQQKFTTGFREMAAARLTISQRGQSHMFWFDLSFHAKRSWAQSLPHTHLVIIPSKKGERKSGEANSCFPPISN